ncbi:MAG: alpha-glucan family phosphorylase [Candidatus Saccharimonas sp.]
MPKNAEQRSFKDFLSHIDNQDDDTNGHDENGHLSELSEFISDEHPIVYFSMEMYDQSNDIKGGGGLGVLAADTRRVAEQLNAPFVIVTLFYPRESHQTLRYFWQHEIHTSADPLRLYKELGCVSIRSMYDDDAELTILERKLGSTRIIAVTEPNLGELYQGGNSDDHRLYQEVALGFGGYQALKQQGIEAAFMQLNESPTVFAAIAKLDDLCQQGLPLKEAIEQTRSSLLYTNHTLVAAAESKFHRDQFRRRVMPNIESESVRDWLDSMFDADGLLPLSLLAIELSGAKSGVSKLHARVSNFSDKDGNHVDFQAVTNGISRKWIADGVSDYYHDLGILDEFDLPSDDYVDKLQRLEINAIRELKSQGRQELNRVLETRLDQTGQPIQIPDDALIFDFKRRFVSYKRAGMVFSDPDRLAGILEEENAHFILTGKPHASDYPMKEELHRILTLVDEHPVLRSRVHYIQDYDEEVGRALSIGADCAINIPEVGREACGTSWMKDIANFKLLISTPDGGVADLDPIACLEVSGDEEYELYKRMVEAAEILRNDDRYLAETIREISGYLPIISGSRMVKEYLGLISRMRSNRLVSTS